MPRESSLPQKSPVESTDNMRLIDASGNSKSADMVDVKTYVGEGTATPFLEVTGSGDDTGINCTEQFSVGKPSSGKESVFGRGDSYGVGQENTGPMGIPEAGSAWHCDLADTTDLVITSATDITNILASDSGSTTSFFGGTTTGKYILLGSDYIFSGLKAKIDTLGTIEPDNVSAEFLSTSTPDWVESKYMATDANYPYTQHGNVLASCNSCSEQWRFTLQVLDPNFVWEKVTLNINGVDYTKYWARFKIDTAITLDPIVEQIKLHTSRFEINEDGNTEHFGLSIYPKSMVVEEVTNSNKNPPNENVKIAPGITLLKTDNEFANGADDGKILVVKVPVGLDTSTPIRVGVDWYAKGVDTGDVKLTVDTVHAGDGFIFDGNGEIHSTTNNITSVDNQELELQRSVFNISIFDTIPNDVVFLSLHRNSLDSEDTYSSNIVVVDSKVTGYFWRP